VVAASLQNLLGANSLSRLHIDLLEAVRVLTAPDKTAPYAIVVRGLQLSDFTVQNEELHVTVSGAVEIRLRRPMTASGLGLGTLLGSGKSLGSERASRNIRWGHGVCDGVSTVLAPLDSGDGG
jgi:hypothetical protein